MFQELPPREMVMHDLFSLSNFCKHGSLLFKSLSFSAHGGSNAMFTRRSTPLCGRRQTGFARSAATMLGAAVEFIIMPFQRKQFLPYSTKQQTNHKGQ